MTSFHMWHTRWRFGGTAFQFSENQTATVCLFGRFYLLRVSASKRSLKRMQLSLVFGFGFGFSLISDLPISG